MFNLFLILMGLFSNPSSTTTSNCDDDPTIVQPIPPATVPSDTGGETGQTPTK